MNVLTVCNYGKNRSAYLAEYLRERGYTIRYGGVAETSDNRITQDDIDWSDIVIFIQPEIKKVCEEHFNIGNRRNITLDVEDRISVLAPEKGQLSGDAWRDFQHSYVYPALKEQMTPYLPLTDAL